MQDVSPPAPPTRQTDRMTEDWTAGRLEDWRTGRPDEGRQDADDGRLDDRRLWLDTTAHNTPPTTAPPLWRRQIRTTDRRLLVVRLESISTASENNIAASTLPTLAHVVVVPAAVQAYQMSPALPLYSLCHCTALLFAASLTCTTLTTAAGAAYATTTPADISAQHSIAARMRQLFAQLDPKRNLFGIMDVDGDGVVSRAEFGTLWVVEGQSEPPGFWVSEDANGDGVVSFDEFTGPKVATGRTAVAATTGLVHQRQGGGGSSPPVSFDALDRNGDRFIDEAELRAYFHFAFSNGVTTQKTPSSEALVLAGVPALFRQHDLDGDGRVSAAEFQAFWARA